MRTLGIIGGTSWHATIEYYRAINEGVGKAIGRQGNPPLIIYSVNIEVMRSRDEERIVSTYREVAHKLQTAGAEGLLIAANTPHLVYEHLREELEIPFLHIADATGGEAQRLQIQKLGLLGNRPTMTGHFIAGKLEQDYGLEILQPQEEDLDHSHHYVSKELTQGHFTEEAREFYRGAIARLQERGAQGVILGCTELPLLLRDEDLDLPLLSSTQLHTQYAINFIMKP